MHCHIVSKIQKLRSIASDLESRIAAREQAILSSENKFGNIDSSVQLMEKCVPPNNPNEQAIKELNLNFDENEINVDIFDGQEILGRDY